MLFSNRFLLFQEKVLTLIWCSAYFTLWKIILSVLPKLENRSQSIVIPETLSLWFAANIYCEAWLSFKFSRTRMLQKNAIFYQFVIINWHALMSILDTPISSLTTLLRTHLELPIWALVCIGSSVFGFMYSCICAQLTIRGRVLASNNFRAASINSFPLVEKKLLIAIGDFEAVWAMCSW